MGLAASQARFLCITARKADCEYKSTELAQQKLEITNQLSDISTEYSNAMNATKLVWSNDAVEGDFGLTYGLMMMPSAANDYNPYMITTPSGAIVLNNEFAAAAKAAGISKAGGAGSQAQRDKFIQALVPGGIITQDTANAITKYDFKAELNSNTNAIEFTNATTVNPGGGIEWNPSAGMGAEPLNKSTVSAMTLYDLILSETIGQKQVDWGQMVVGENELTEVEYQNELNRLYKLVNTAQGNEINKDIINQLKRDLSVKESERDALDPNASDYSTQLANKNNEIDQLEDTIKNAEKIMDGQYQVQSGTSDEYILDDNGNITATKVADVYTNIITYLQGDYDTYKNGSGRSYVSADNAYGGKFNISGNSLNAENKYKDSNGAVQTAKTTYSIVQNGVINHYAAEISEMSIGDLLSSDIVLMANNQVGSINEFREQVIKLFNSVAAVFGYSASEDLTGQGLNVDEASANALKFAYDMVIGTYLSTRNDPADSGSRYSDSAMTDNSAYQNAVNYNKIGTDSNGSYYAVSLSNMMSAFLTYYENALSGADSSYVVGASPETSVYVTDNSGYYYIAQDDPNAVTSVVDKSADFYDELYNNILEHGWREDAAIDDSEYLESAIKDGRYSMSSLNNDGYYYQTRYNETGYIVEVSDTDAIARAEAEFTSKKADLTYKEDSIDLKTKQLDAEISSLSTEYDTVKNLISKSIEKTFTMFSS